MLTICHYDCSSITLTQPSLRCMYFIVMATLLHIPNHDCELITYTKSWLWVTRMYSDSYSPTQALNYSCDSSQLFIHICNSTTRYSTILILHHGYSCMHTYFIAGTEPWLCLHYRYSTIWLHYKYSTIAITLPQLLNNNGNSSRGTQSWIRLYHRESMITLSLPPYMHHSLWHRCSRIPATPPPLLNHTLPATLTQRQNHSYGMKL